MLWRECVHTDILVSHIRIIYLICISTKTLRLIAAETVYFIWRNSSTSPWLCGCRWNHGVQQTATLVNPQSWPVLAVLLLRPYPIGSDHLQLTPDHSVRIFHDCVLVSLRFGGGMHITQGSEREHDQLVVCFLRPISIVCRTA